MGKKTELKLDLYTPDGWINIEEISKLGCWLNVIVGARQVGKTYGTLKHLCGQGTKSIYLRRTVDELDLVSSHEDLNPFKPLEAEGYHVDMLKAGKSMYVWGDADTEDDKRVITTQRGIGLALGTIAKMRGFSGGQFTDVLFDEFIPEKTVIRRKGEGDALLNAYTTINGNRELNGQPPLRMWLLANAFDISSEILLSLGLTGEFDRLIRRGEEYTLLDGGVFLAFPRSERVIGKRSKTAMMSYLDKHGAGVEFRDMALANSFAYDNTQQVKPMSLKGMKPLAKIGDMYAYTNSTIIYITNSPHHTGAKYGTTREERTRCQLECPIFRRMYNNNWVYFETTPLLLRFKSYFGIKD